MPCPLVEYRTISVKNICLCDFAKRCLLSLRLNTGIARVQASVFGKKTGGVPSCEVSAESPGPDLSMGGGGGGFFVLCEKQGGREGRFCRFD